jgi:hypothetical protein
MLIKILIVISLGVALVIGAKTLTRTKTPLTQEWSKLNSVAAAARKAKENGQKTAEILGPRIDYGGSQISFEKAREIYSVVIAEPVEKKSDLVNENKITTWYKFEINEVLSERPTYVCSSCPTPASPAQGEFLLEPNQFIINKVGGTVTIDGVDVTMIDRDLPNFEIGQKYLLFISKNPSGVATFGAGPAGVFQLSKDGTISPMGPKETPLSEGLNRVSGRQLGSLKVFIN